MLNRIRNLVKRKSILTAERPTVLEADVLARYRFASTYCKGKTVLDVGCGLGFGDKYLIQKGAKFVMAVDYNKETIDYLKESSALNPKIVFFQKNALDIDKIEKKFEVVLAFEILEHIPVANVNRFILNLKKVLSSKGILLLSTPNGMNTKTLFGKPYNPYHVKEYKPEEVKALLEKYFLKIHINGIENKNTNYHIKQNEIEKKLLYRLVYFIGHFKVVRELVAYIPKKMKQKVTNEDTLPIHKQKDFVLTPELSNCPGLFVSAVKNN